MDNPSKTRLERMRSWFENHPIFSVLMFLSTGLAALSTCVTSGIVILNTFGILNAKPVNRQSPPEQTDGVAATSPAPAQPEFTPAKMPTPDSTVTAPVRANAEVRRAEPARPPVHLESFYTPAPASVSETVATPVPVSSPAATPEHDELVPVRRAAPVDSAVAQ